MARIHAVGIDLGTTFSAVGYVSDTGQTTMLRGSEGELLTPSVVMFDDDEVVVGQRAKRNAGIRPDSVAECVKRDMGKSTFSHPIHGENLPPAVIQACILKHLRQDISAVLGDEFETVITVPAYFDEARRKATVDAGFMAGFTVMDIINEPTAAALAFGEHLGYLAVSGTPREEMTVLVYDLGGGTFDVTAIRLKPGDVRTLATDGDVRLGGRDWDQRLVNYAADAFLSEHGEDPRQDAGSCARLFQAAEQAKHQLSIRTRTHITVEHFGRSSAVPISRDRFAELTADLLERTNYTTRQVLAAAKLDWDDVARVLMVGGSTRMPMVAKMLEELSGITPDHTVNPDEAVARGAAIYAGYLLAIKGKAGAAPQFKVVDVNSHSLGIEGLDQTTGRKENVILIPRNTPLPVRVHNRFVTKMKGQTSIAVKVLEGESTDPENCILIGKAVLRELPPELRKGHPINVSYRYAANGRLDVRASVPGTDREVAIELERESGMSHDRTVQWRDVVTAKAGFGAFEEMLEDVLQLEGMDPGGADSGAAPSGPQAGEAKVRWGGTPGRGSTPPEKAATVQRSPKTTSGQPQGAPPPAAKSNRPIPVAPSERKTEPAQADGPEPPFPRPAGRSAIRKSNGAMWITVIGCILAGPIGLFIGYLILAYFKIVPGLW